MVGTAIAGICMSAVQMFSSGIAANDQAKSLKASARATAAQAAMERSQAAAERQAAAMEQAQYYAQAGEHKTAAKIAEMQAINEQRKGEQEANKRSRILAADIGSTYANWAGNGLMVDGSSTDTLGGILSSEAQEASADISTIRDNTAMSMWTYQANAAKERQSANNLIMAGDNALKIGNMNADITMQKAAITDRMGKIQWNNAKSARKQGLLLTAGLSKFM